MIEMKYKLYAYSGGKCIPVDDNSAEIKIKFIKGVLTVEYAIVPLGKLQIEWDVSFSKGSKYFCDAWERGYGDFSLSDIPKDIMPWYFLCIGKKSIRCFGVKTKPNALCYWHYENGSLVLTADIRSGKNEILLNGKKLKVCEVVAAEYNNEFFEASKKFCKVMCDDPILPKTPVFGGNDWYCNYGNSSYEKIVEHTKRIVECSGGLEYKPYMVVDDGWELCHHQSENDDEYFNGGPWIPNRNFKNMQKLAKEITALGAIPGVWIRPLWTTEKVPEKMVLKHYHTKYTLDPSNESALEQIENDIKRIVSWGYKLIKHDFTTFDIFGKWGNDGNFLECNMNFSDKTKTTAEVIKALYKTIRKAAPDCIIMGCNTMSHLAAGYFHIQRTGDDTSGVDWERTKTMGINTLAYRMCQHESFYSADADCVGITTKIPWSKNREWLDVLSKSGTPLFVSIAEDAYTDEVRNDIKNAFENASGVWRASVPCNMESMIPQKWKSCFGQDVYKW